MANDASEVVVGADGTVWVGPVGATAPDDSTSTPDAAFTDLGFISEDGATVGDSKEIQNIGAWQSLYPIRRIITSREFTIGFALRQWNGETIALAFGGGTVDDAPGGGYMYTPPDAGVIDERALILDWEDDDKHYRMYVPRGIVAENVETNLVRTAAADLAITFSALTEGDADPYTLFTDDPAFAPAS